MLHLPKLFRDHMVLQREKPVAVWGKGAPYRPVTVRLQGQCKQAVAALDGSWRVTLDPLCTAASEQMTITDADSEIQISDVAIGEVWFAGGQSNMEFQMRYVKDVYKEYGFCKNRNIRVFDTPRISYEGQDELEDYSRFGFWRTANADNLDYFTAVGYYFAKELQHDLDVPVGILSCNLGGSPACAWIDEEHLRGTAAEVWLQDYAEATKELDLDAYYRNFFASPFHYSGNPFANPINENGLRGDMAGMADALEKLMGGNFAPAQIGPYFAWRPCGLHHTMLRKVAPYTVRGFLYYQGESDDAHAEIYDTTLKILIQNWRELWREELPFLYVQLAPFGNPNMNCDKYPTLRAKQQAVANSVPNAYMAVISDVGSEQDIHPKDKAPVGHRLALLAEKYVYSRPVEAEAPTLERAEVCDGIVRLFFANAADGLSINGEALHALEILQDGAAVTGWTAQVTGKAQVTVAGSFRSAAKTTVKFAGTPYYEVNLYNSAGLPARPVELEL